MENSDSNEASGTPRIDIVTGKASLATNVQFRFGTRTIQATGSAADRCHPNVLLLRIEGTFVQYAIKFLCQVLSTVTGSWIESKFPEWFLPERIVLKFQKLNWEEEFDNELIAYHKLQPIQGLTIPKLFGITQYNNTRALILSDIGGYCVATPEGAVLDEQDMRPLTYHAFKSLHDLGVSHGDAKLDNFHLVTDDGKDKIMIVDLESADYEQTEEELAYTAKTKTNFVMRQYHNHLECMKHDCVLLPKRPLRA
ncbi:uncharacterized protein FRV6_16844 [Fusarium oxysporum]|uniref:Protein kinase domain-containing protein n=1 Tax=Fusarium oxysporum TaxID=5507 RepID=A0A2H3UBU4_FUSOX|nr:uncharacterized protein FRV6_16844 [Fusarium oxysporum]